MKKTSIALIFTLGTVLLLTNCKKDDQENPSKEALITKLIYLLIPEDGEPGVALEFEDLDGDGGLEPTISYGFLEANQTYNGTINVLDESGEESENITAKIWDEAADHQFFFQSDISGINIDYEDQDPDNNPVGISTKLTTGDVDTGTLTITLLYKPIKDAEGVANGDITNAGGERSIEVIFPIEIQ